MDPKTGKLVEGTVADRTVRPPAHMHVHSSSHSLHSTLTLLTHPQHQCIRNLAAVLSAAGSDIDHVFKVNVFLSDMSLFVPMNDVYKTYWGDMKPARTCVAVKQLPLGTDVEIECQAVLP